ncbi:hypothetical protein BC830DRAFT_175561, partial [Chytriomyces sp. MP71]
MHSWSQLRSLRWHLYIVWLRHVAFHNLEPGYFCRLVTFLWMVRVCVGDFGTAAFAVMRVTQTASPGATGSPSSAGGGGGGGGGGPSMILCASFNQDASCLSVGFPSSQDPHGTGTSGFAVFNCDPFGRFYSSSSSPSSEGASFSVVEMLFTTSLVALVGAGHTPQQSPRRLQIVNTKRDSTICELTFVSSILAVKLNRRRLVVVLEEHIYIYDISNMKLLHTIDTSPNPHGMYSQRSRGG